MQQVEDKYLTIINTMDVGFCIVQLIFDAAQQPIDYLHLECNPIFEQQMGVQNLAGRTMRELAPDTEPFWFTTYGKVALSGEHARFVHYSSSVNKWFAIFAFPIGDPAEHQVAVLYNDISERKQAEEALLNAIRLVAAGGSYIDPVLAAGSLVANTASHAPSAAITVLEELTARERDVLRRIAWGHSNKEIAARFAISVKTVEYYKAQAITKLHLHSRTDIVRYALAQGWLNANQEPQ